MRLPPILTARGRGAYAGAAVLRASLDVVAARRLRGGLRPFSDTDPETERVHLELLRQAGPRRRGQMALDLTQAVIATSRRALRRLHPHATEEELGVLWVRQNYGDELADGLQADLARRRRG